MNVLIQTCNRVPNGRGLPNPVLAVLDIPLNPEPLLFTAVTEPAPLGVDGDFVVCDT